jgi:hypothetical protein
METWFAKSVLATLAIVPSFLAIPFFKARFGVDPLVFLVWYFGATAASIAVVLALNGRAAELAPGVGVVAAAIGIGLTFGALANGALFQAIGLAPNPGLPPVVYASSSVIVFALSALLAASLPSLFRPVSADFVRLGGVLLVLGGLYLLARGR